MAKIILNPNDLPERGGEPIPGSKPPIRFPMMFTDDGDPAEADAFNEMIRRIRHNIPDQDR